MFPKAGKPGVLECPNRGDERDWDGSRLLELLSKM
jgi:hypothetical protein